MVKCKSGGWRWYVKPTKEKGPDKSVCFGYGHHDDIVLPNDCTAANWSVYDGSKFVIESQVTCVPDPAVPPLPERYHKLVKERNDLYQLEVKSLNEEVLGLCLVLYIIFMLICLLLLFTCKYCRNCACRSQGLLR